jgi:hypothetical protein
MLDFGFIETRGPVGVPPARVNGGLFTGEPFEDNAPWGNGKPVPPEAHAYMRAHPLIARGRAIARARPKTRARFTTKSMTTCFVLNELG